MEPDEGQLVLELEHSLEHSEVLEVGVERFHLRLRLLRPLPLRPVPMLQAHERISGVFQDLGDPWR